MSDLSKTTSRPKPPATWKVGAVTILTFVALLYVIEAWDAVHQQELNADGIRPLEADGLWGILWAPLLHANWAHLIGNTGPALVLGFLATLAGMGRFLAATLIIWIGGGLGTWLIGNIGSPAGVESVHIGASGLIFGWLTFLIVFGFFTRRAWQIVVGVVVLFIYGGVLWGALPGTFGVSWQGHLSGGIAGVYAAYLLSKPERQERERRKRSTLPSVRA
ncbi:rhomboid family intramembrane serine protease [Mycobacterium sp. OTB74]|uniref:rhomboid family intramembrane serine protease n=1 Tax=Mycobacterium sp. OTB74 TaxID=1853452 RepID=UPI002474152B|nr:rhomboid family intramembrane serine protease [Mycobacterium sp. OTB74]MDH6245160.1 membrane associated rhomboid family serine protease [Mycobacterium sp. OTB74]